MSIFRLTAPTKPTNYDTHPTWNTETFEYLGHELNEILQGYYSNDMTETGLTTQVVSFDRKNFMDNGVAPIREKVRSLTQRIPKGSIVSIKANYEPHELPIMNRIEYTFSYRANA